MGNVSQLHSLHELHGRRRNGDVERQWRARFASGRGGDAVERSMWSHAYEDEHEEEDESIMQQQELE